MRNHRLGGRRAVLTLPHTAYQLLQVEAPDVDPTELRAAIRWRIKDLIDYHVDDAVVDVIDVPQARGRSGPQLMYAVSAKISEVRAYTDALEAAELDIEAIDVAELALRNIAALVPEQGGGVAMVALAENTGLITISHGDTLYLARHLEFGTQALTSSPETYNDTLALEIQRSLDFYESQLSAAPASKIMLAPMAMDRSALLDLLQEQMPAPCFGLELQQIMELGDGLEPGRDYIDLLAVGAALREEERAL